MYIVGCIPARMGSSRFPGKPMVLIHGVPMIGHVYLRCKQARLLDDLYVATCDKEIFDYILSIGGKAIMTDASHPGCIDRCNEAMKKIEAETKVQIDVMVIIQGDEPLVHPDMIDEAVSPLAKDPAVQIVNLMGRIKSEEEFNDINEIKVVVDSRSNALYFSREPVPCSRKGGETAPRWKQICVIPMRRELLEWFGKMKRTPLETAESIDMLRLLENGIGVRMVPTEHRMKSVDTPEDLARVVELMREDPLFTTTKS